MLKSNVAIAVLQISGARGHAFLGREFDGYPCAGRFTAWSVELFGTRYPDIRQVELSQDIRAPLGDLDAPGNVVGAVP